MKADEIRELADSFDATTNLQDGLYDGRFQNSMLAEIAAQLAEMNTYLAAYCAVAKQMVDAYGRIELRMIVAEARQAQAGQESK